MLTSRFTRADGSVKAGKEANAFAAEGVVKIDIPRPLLNDVDV